MTWIAALLLVALPFMAPAANAQQTAEELGARHGQALAAARHCPGARTTAKANDLGHELADAQRAAYEAASGRILDAWEKAFACRDVDPAQYPREVNSCRKSKILTCTSTWSEIGPEGSAIQGLLEFAPAD